MEAGIGVAEKIPLKSVGTRIKRMFLGFDVHGIVLAHKRHRYRASRGRVLVGTPEGLEIFEKRNLPRPVIDFNARTSLEERFPKGKEINHHVDGLVDKPKRLVEALKDFTGMLDRD